MRAIKAKLIKQEYFNVPSWVTKVDSMTDQQVHEVYERIMRERKYLLAKGYGEVRNKYVHDGVLDDQLHRLYDKIEIESDYIHDDHIESIVVWADNKSVLELLYYVDNRSSSLRCNLVEQVVLDDLSPEESCYILNGKKLERGDEVVHDFKNDLVHVKGVPNGHIK